MQISRKTYIQHSLYLHLNVRIYDPRLFFGRPLFTLALSGILIKLSGMSTNFGLIISRPKSKIEGGPKSDQVSKSDQTGSTV